jgi:predicted TIM-barrel fold metal-dependent hydrolase
MDRRQFLGTLAFGATELKSMAQVQDGPRDSPDWGGPVLDIHLHGKGPDGEWAHMQGCGVSYAQLLTAPSAEAHVKEEMAKHPRRFKYSVSVDPARADALELLRTAVKGGATGFGEMKSRSKADSSEMKSVYALASELSVPVTIHFADYPQFDGDTAYNEGITRFEAVLKAYPRTTFIGHADSFWANISADVPPAAYPAGLIKPGGITDALLAKYQNLYADMSANSCRNALARDPEFIRGFLIRHQDKLMFGSDCSCRDGRGAGQGSQQPLIKGKCVARETLAALKELASQAIFRKIAWENGAKLFGFKA